MINNVADSIKNLVRRKVSQTSYNATIGAGHIAGRVARKLGAGNAFKIAAHGIVQGVNRGEQLATANARHMRHLAHAKPKNRLILTQQ